MQKCKTTVLKCVSIMRLIIEVKNPTEELTSIYFITLVVGYFAALNMTYFFLHVILNDSEESHRVSEEYILYEKPPSREFAAPTARKDSILGLAIIRWDISLRSI